MKDIAGKPIIIAGKQYGHLKEVTEALHGLGRELNNLNKAIDGGKFPCCAGYAPSCSADFVNLRLKTVCSKYVHLFAAANALMKF
jgi:hypothetical protein